MSAPTTMRWIGVGALPPPLLGLLRAEGRPVELVEDAAELTHALKRPATLVIGRDTPDVLPPCTRAHGAGRLDGLFLLVERGPVPPVVQQIDWVDFAFSDAAPLACINRLDRLARLTARRVEHLCLDDRTVDLGTGRIEVETGGRIRLTSTELRLVLFLLRARGRPVSREELLEEVWDYDPDALTRTVDLTVARARRKLEPDPAEPRHLLTVWGKGYRLIGFDEPGPERASAAHPPRSPRASVPPGFSRHVQGPLLGRERLLEQIRERLNHVRQLCLYGLPGVGKSRLALEAAMQLAAEHGSGQVVVVDCQGETDRATLLDRIAAEAGVEVDDVFVGLDERRGLVLVLDDLAHGRPEMARLLADLATRVGHLRVIATHILPPPPPWSEDSLRVDPLDTRTGVRLLMYHLRRLADRELARPEPDLRRLIERVGGLPLAIHQVALRLRMFSLPELRRRLERSLDVLYPAPSPAAGRSARRANLGGRVWFAFDESQRRLISSLVQFPSGCEPAGLAAVSRMDDVDVRPLLDGFVAAQLVELSGSGPTLRIDVRPFMRHHLAHLVSAHDPDFPGRMRMATYVARCAPDWLRQVLEEGADPSRLTDEADNLSAALDHFAQRGSRHVEVIGDALRWAYLLGDRPDRWADWLEKNHAGWSGRGDAAGVWYLFARARHAADRGERRAASRMASRARQRATALLMRSLTARARVLELETGSPARLAGALPDARAEVADDRWPWLESRLAWLAVRDAVWRDGPAAADALVERARILDRRVRRVPDRLRSDLAHIAWIAPRDPAGAESRLAELRPAVDAWTMDLRLEAAAAGALVALELDAPSRACALRDRFRDARQQMTWPMFTLAAAGFVADRRTGGTSPTEAEARFDAQVQSLLELDTELECLECAIRLLAAADARDRARAQHLWSRVQRRGDQLGACGRTLIDLLRLRVAEVLDDGPGASDERRARARRALDPGGPNALAGVYRVVAHGLA